MSVRPEIESLLQARVDGTLTDAELAELNRLLATDRDVRLRAAEIDALAEMIDALGDVDPPAGMTDQILSAIATHPVNVPVAHNARIATFESNTSRATHSGARVDGRNRDGQEIDVGARCWPP
jgi:anti-sigma factor RsiW